MQPVVGGHRYIHIKMKDMPFFTNAGCKLHNRASAPSHFLLNSLCPLKLIKNAKMWNRRPNFKAPHDGLRQTRTALKTYRRVVSQGNPESRDLALSAPASFMPVPILRLASITLEHFAILILHSMSNLR